MNYLMKSCSDPIHVSFPGFGTLSEAERSAKKNSDIPGFFDISPLSSSKGLSTPKVRRANVFLSKSNIHLDANLSDNSCTPGSSPLYMKSKNNILVQDGVFARKDGRNGESSGKRKQENSSSKSGDIESANEADSTLDKNVYDLKQVNLQIMPLVGPEKLSVPIKRRSKRSAGVEESDAANDFIELDPLHLSDSEKPSVVKRSCKTSKISHDAHQEVNAAEFISTRSKGKLSPKILKRKSLHVKQLETQTLTPRRGPPRKTCVLKVVATELPVSPPKDVTVVGGRKSHRLNRPSLL